MRSIDLNCDMGEGAGNDAAIMPYISSASIACGYHAGDERTIHETINLALQHQVSIGAHVSFLDKENFGRKEMHLPANLIYDLVQAQLFLFQKAAQACNATVRHVKPHGALYNMSARNADLALTIAEAVYDVDPSLVLVGLSGSHSITAAGKKNLITASEVFADRTYEEDGSLRSRALPGALLEDTDAAIRQVLQMINDQTVTAFTGKTIPISAQTICIHGDGKHAVSFAQNIYQQLKRQSIEIKAF